MSSPRRRDHLRGVHRLLSISLAVLACVDFFMSSHCVKGEDEAGCVEAKLDVVVLLDSSGSVGSSNFRKTKDFAAKILGHLPVGPDSVRVAVVSYSTRAYTQSYLNKDMDKGTKLKKLVKMRYRPGLTYTNKGLQTVREVILTPNHGDRPDVKDLIILTTDGESSDKKRTYEEIDLLKQRKDLTILVIGIGKYTSRSEMEYMASSPSMVRHVTSFANLASIVYDMSAMSCTASMEVESPSTMTSTSKEITYAETTEAITTQTTTSPSTETTQAVTSAKTRTATTTTRATIKTTQAETSATTTATKTTQAVTSATTIPTIIKSPSSETVTTETELLLSTGGPITITLPTVPKNDKFPSNPNLPAEPSFAEDCSLAKVDVVVVLDFSGSNGFIDLERAKDIMANTLRQLPVDLNAIRVAMVDCSSGSRIQSYLDEDTGKDDKLKKVATTTYGGSGDVGKCLQAVREDVLTLKHGDRPEIRDFVILITNRKAGDQTAAFLQADLLKTRDRLMVFVIAIGIHVSISELEYIASSPMMVQNASSLANLPSTDISVPICTTKGSNVKSISSTSTTLDTESTMTKKYNAETGGTSSSYLETMPRTPQMEEHSSSSKTTIQTATHSSPCTSAMTCPSSTNSEPTLRVEQTSETGKNTDLRNSTASSSHQNATNVEPKRFKGLRFEDVGLMVGAALGATIILAVSACCVYVCCRKKTHIMKREDEPLRKGIGEYYGE